MNPCNLCRRLNQINQQINYSTQFLEKWKAKHVHKFQRLDQVEEQLAQLQTLQKENPTRARELTIKYLAREQANVRSFLNVLGIKTEKEIQKQRERAQKLRTNYTCSCVETESEPEWSENEDTPIEPHFNLDDVPFPKPTPEPTKPEIDYQALYEAQLLATQLFQNTCRDLEQQIARLKKQVQARPTKKNYRQISHENQELTDFNQQLLAELTSLQTQIIQIQHQATTEQQVLNAQVNNLTTERNQAQNRVNDLTEQLANRAEITPEELTALTNQRNQTQVQFNTVQTSLTNLTNQRDIFRRRYQENKTKLNQTLETNQQLQNQINQIITQAQHWKNQFQTAQQETQAKNQAITGLNQQVKNLNQKNLLKQKQIIELIQTISYHENKTKDLTELLTKREKKTERLKNRLNQTQKKLTRTKQYQKNQNQNEKNQLQSEISSLKGQLTYYQDQDNKLRDTIQNLQTQINNHTCPDLTGHTCPTLSPHICSPCPLIHLPEPHKCPIVNQIECSHESQEQVIIQRLNTAFNLNEKDLQGIISKVKELIDKPPLTITDKTIKQELTQAHQIITKLEKQLTEKTIGEKIETIIKIDEKLLNENANLKIELNKQSQDYQQLAEERNRLVLQQIKDINVVKLQQLIPNAQEKVIRQNLQKARNYEELSNERNKLVIKYMNQNTQQKLINPKQLSNNNDTNMMRERKIWISLLVVSLVGIGGLLVKLKGAKKA